MMFHKVLLRYSKVNQSKNIKVIPNQIVIKKFLNLRGRSHFEIHSKRSFLVRIYQNMTARYVYRGKRIGITNTETSMTSTVNGTPTLTKSTNL